MPASAASTSATSATGRTVRKREPPADWTPLLSAIAATVSECNIVAGEPLWTVLRPQTDPSRLKVCYAGKRTRCLELSLRRGRAVLRCVYGCDCGSATVELKSAGTNILTGGRCLTVGETATMLLDALVAGLD